MTLPGELFQAVSAQGGGKIVIVLGAGCSVEAPTNIPVAKKLAMEVHRRLLADGVLQAGDCSDPNDLSHVADAVFIRKRLQRDVVERLCEQCDFKLATPNDGYIIVAAMLCEGAISSVITLNFDLALSNALSKLGAGHLVGLIECPDDFHKQKNINVYYLHGNANANPESWVLRTVTVQDEWRGHWQPIITTKVLATPVVVFAGLGTPAVVLIESVKLLRNALGQNTKIYQVDLIKREDSIFFQELGIEARNYIQYGWGQFMHELSQRLLEEQVAKLEQAVDQKVNDDHLPVENVVHLLARLKALGLVKLGKLRAHWLLDDKYYCPVEPNVNGLIADLLLALAMMARVSGSEVIIADDGLVEFHRDSRVVNVFLVASGRGYWGKPAIEVKVGSRLNQYRSRLMPPRGVIVGGTSDPWTAAPTLPLDIIHEDESGSIIAGAMLLPLIHISELRAQPNRIQEVVP